MTKISCPEQTSRENCIATREQALALYIHVYDERVLAIYIYIHIEGVECNTNKSYMLDCHDGTTVYISPSKYLNIIANLYQHDFFFRNVALSK